MNQDKGIISIVLIIVLSVVLIGAAAGYYFISNKSNDEEKSDEEISETTVFNENDVTSNEPYLLMNIVEYPSSIPNYCQEVTLAIEVENKGEKTLEYDDLGDTYALKIMSEDALSRFTSISGVDPVETTENVDEYGIITYQDIVGDFGELKPGDKTTLYYTSLSYVINDQHEYFYKNSFDSVLNGTFHYFVVFEKLPEEGKSFSTEISRSDSVSITTDIWESENEYSYCEHELITDQSVDFYK